MHSEKKAYLYRPTQQADTKSIDYCIPEFWSTMHRENMHQINLGDNWTDVSDHAISISEICPSYAMG